MFEAVRTYPGYGVATLIYNNLLNLILGTVFFLISNYMPLKENITISTFTAGVSKSMECSNNELLLYTDKRNNKIKQTRLLSLKI